MAIFFDDGMYTLDAVERILIWKFLIGNNMMLKGIDKFIIEDFVKY